MRKLIRLFSLFLLIAALLSVPAANGQGGATGAISGTVTDVSGGSVADAEVQILNSATDLLVRRQNTGPDGSFVATLLPPGNYYLATVDPSEQGEWFEPAYLDEHRLGATRVALGDGETKTQDFRIRTQ